jgi:hypothetical protein
MEDGWKRKFGFALLGATALGFAFWKLRGSAVT